MEKQYDCMLTTIDNPFDPFEQFDDWYRFDIEKQYYSAQRWTRFAHFTDDMTEQEEREESERAMDEFIALDFLDLYKKVKKPIEIQENN